MLILIMQYLCEILVLRTTLLLIEMQQSYPGGLFHSNVSAPGCSGQIEKRQLRLTDVKAEAATHFARGSEGHDGNTGG